MKALLGLSVPVVLLAQIDVPYQRIRDADTEPGNWLTYSRDYTGQRYSPLDQIDTSNVGKLRISYSTIRVTPAMQAGIRDHIRDIAELLN
jgi:alcohol dehydrogenase (cytochrome c)